MFSVVKRYSEDPGGEKRLVSRLVWDCRKNNHLFHAPPWMALGSPAALANPELSDDVLGGREA
eukprot:9775942-Lingulodinium_polyedra.AAC.1